MRVISLLLAGGLLASCTTAPEPTDRAANKQAELAKLLTGKVANGRSLLAALSLRGHAGDRR